MAMPAMQQQFHPQMQKQQKMNMVMTGQNIMIQPSIQPQQGTFMQPTMHQGAQSNFNQHISGGSMRQFQPFLWRLGAEILGTSVIVNNNANDLHECLTPPQK